MTTIAFVGDIMLGRGVNEQIRWQRAETFWGTTLPVLQSADAVIANLECAITRRQRRWDQSPKVFHYRADMAAVDVLRAANIRCVSLANNHALDYGYDGMFEMIDRLELADVAHAGAGRNLDEACVPAVFDVGELKVGVISLTDNEPPFAAGELRPGINYLDIDSGNTAAAISRSIAQARSGGARFIIVSAHQGPNMVAVPSPRLRKFKQSCIAAGADLVHGHSAHVFQAVEIVNQRPVLHDTGDFLDDYAVDPVLRNDWSFIFLTEIRDTRVVRVQLLPVKLSFAQVNLASDQEARDICDAMLQRCAGFATQLTRTDEGLELVMPNVRQGAPHSKHSNAARHHAGKVS